METLQLAVNEIRNAGQFTDAAARLIVDVFKQLIMRLPRDLVRMSDVEDLVQSALYKVCADKGQKIASAKNPKQYVKQIVLHLAIDAYRHRKSGEKALREFGKNLEPIKDTLSPVRAAGNDELADLLECWLAQLDEKDRQIVEAFYYREKSIKAIAEIHGTTAGTVATRLRRARLKLREISKRR